MQRLIIKIPDRMNEALRQEADRRTAPIAAVVREAIAEYLDKRGVSVKSAVEWGGKRGKDDEDHGE